MDRAGIKKGMTVADIGAGEGYYTIRLAQRVGKEGRVLAEDIVPAVRDALAERVARERLDNVSVRLGLPADPRLPEASFDRMLMVHMYHEIEQPYEFLWRLRPALKRRRRKWWWSMPTARPRTTAPRPICCNASSPRSATHGRDAADALGGRLYRDLPARAATRPSRRRSVAPARRCQTDARSAAS